MKGRNMRQFDRYLALPEQLAALRADGRGGNVLLEILKFLGILVLAFLGEMLAQMLVTFVVIFATIWQAGGNVDAAAGIPDWGVTAMGLFATAGMIGVTVLVIRFVQKRKLSTAGLSRPFWKEYGLGLLAGFAAFALAVLIAVVTGSLRITGLSGSFAAVPFLVLFLGFLVQGFSEELLCRGCFMLSVARKNSVAAGILCNALVFAALHLLNSGIGPLPIVNLFLFGVLASLYYLWRGNLWGIAAFHSMWNFTQGNIFGILVSGGDYGVSLLTSELTGSALINGGDFGMEGGLAVTAAMVIGIVLVEWRNIDRIARTPMPLER